MAPTPSSLLSSRGPGQRSAGVTALVTLLAALLGFFLLVLHDALSRAATQQTQGLQQVALLWGADEDCGDARTGACVLPAAPDATP